MPTKQRGFARRRGNVWLAGWYENGKQRTRGGFRTKTTALDYANGKASEMMALKAAVRFGDRLPRPVSAIGTVDELVDLFLEKHGRTIDPATVRKLRQQLQHVRAEFGDRHPDSLNRLELEDFRAGLPAGVRHDVFRAFRQALAWGAARDLIGRDASVGIKNPKRRRHERKEVFPFESWEQVEMVAAELDPRYRAIPIVMAGTGLRPEEAFGLHRADVTFDDDRRRGRLHVRRRFTQGVLKEGTKTKPERLVPFTGRVYDALKALPPRIDTPVLFPAPRGGHIDGERFRSREWAPALRAAGIEHRAVKDLRSTFISWHLSKGTPVATVAEWAGNSISQIEDTYRRYIRSEDEYASRIDNYDAATAAERGR